MLRITNLSNVFQKRTLRVKYGHTQATPYAGSLHPSLRDASGSFRKPISTDTLPLARSADAFTHKGGLVPGTVMVKAEGESFVVANGANAAVRPFGLLANFVGGELDDLKDNNEIGVWNGVDSVYEVLAPAFDDTGLAAAYAAATAGVPVLLYARPNGLLGAEGTPGNRLPVAELIERPSASKILVKLLV